MKLSNGALLKNQCFINGQWVGKPELKVLNPANDALLAQIPQLGAAETGTAVEAAHKAFVIWSHYPVKERARILRRWYELIQNNREDLAQIITAEQGKPLKESLSEIDSTASFFEFYGEESKRIYGETIPSPIKDARITVIKQPVGVVGAITPWNFPSSMIARKVAPALAVGCTVVLKPSELTPLSAFALAVLGEEAGVPAGVFNIVTGPSQSIGEVLTQHPQIRAITFTGSTPVGKKLMAQAAKGIKKIGMELGGNAPFIVFDDADLDAAVEGVMASKFRNSGQTCVCANRIYVHEKIQPVFMAKLLEAVRKLQLGNGAEKETTLGPLITHEAMKKVERLIEDALGKGARVEEGGTRAALGDQFFQATVLSGMTQEMEIAREEIFGPVAPVFTFKTEEEALQKANDTEYGLAAYFYSRDIGRIVRVYEGLQYGMVGVNSGMVSTEVAPFGGIKESGLGREGSRHGVDEFLNLKYVLLAGIG